MTAEQIGSYKMPFSGPAYAQTMDNLRLACLIPDDYLAQGAHFPDPDEIIMHIYNELSDECYKSAMHFGPFRGISGKHDTIDNRLEAIHDFFAGMGSKCYFNKAMSTIKHMKCIILGFATDWDQKCAISVPILEKSICIGEMLDRWHTSDEKKFFTRFIRDICEGTFYMALKDFPWLAAQIMKPAFKNFYRDHLRNILNRKKSEGKNAYDVRHGTYRRRRQKIVPIAPVVARLRPEPKVELEIIEPKKSKAPASEKAKERLSKSEKARARDRRAHIRTNKQRETQKDHHITIWTPLFRSPKMLGTILPILIKRMKRFAKHPTLNIINERRSFSFAAVHS